MKLVLAALLLLFNTNCGTEPESETRSELATTAGSFVPMNPVRLVDTRTQNAPLQPNESRLIHVAGQGGIGSTPLALAISITVVEASSDGYVNAYASGTVEPGTSVINFAAGETIANFAIVKVGADGNIVVAHHASGPAHLVIDVEGYFAPATRNGLALVKAAYQNQVVSLDPFQQIDIPVTAAGGMLAGQPVAAITAHFRVYSPPTGYLTVQPRGAPNASTVVSFDGGELDTTVMVGVPANGSITVVNNSPSLTSFYFDVVGVARANVGAIAGSYVPLTPTRIVDTRAGIGIWGPLYSFNTSGYPMALPSGLVPPTGARFAVLNVTSVGPSDFGTLWIGRSTVALLPGKIRSTSLLVPLEAVATNGLPATNNLTLTVAPSSQIVATHLVVDLVGYVTGVEAGTASAGYLAPAGQSFTSATTDVAVPLDSVTIPEQLSFNIGMVALGYATIALKAIPGATRTAAFSMMVNSNAVPSSSCILLGSSVSCSVPFAWQAGGNYRLKVVSPTDGTIKAIVEDLATGKSKAIGTITGVASGFNLMSGSSSVLLSHRDPSFGNAAEPMRSCSASPTARATFSTPIFGSTATTAPIFGYSAGSCSKAAFDAVSGIATFTAF